MTMSARFLLTPVALGISALTALPSFAMTPGEYTTSAMGRNGEVTVSIKVDQTRLLDVQVTSQKETPGIGDLAVKTLPAQMVKEQSIAVDNVSGATLSSQALKNAVKAGLVKAGADLKSFERVNKKVVATTPLVTNADIIVVGGGGAGMVAATTAIGRGASVIVLEKMAMLGGNTARSEGNISAMDPEPEKLLPMTQAVRDIIAKYTDIPPCNEAVAKLQKTVKEQLAAHDQAGKKYLFDSPELFALQTLIGGDCKSDPALVLTLTSRATEAMNWLDEQSPMTWYHVPRHWLDVGIGGLYPRGQWPRAEDGKTPISTYDAYIAPLAEKVTAAGGHIYTSMKVVRILRSSKGAVTGVVAQDAQGKEHTFHASKVILAAGGYGANLAMVKHYNNISVTATSNAPGTTGEVINEALKVGAALEGMKWIQIHPHGNPKNGELESAIAGRPQDTPYVNKDGVRFVDETGRRDEISYGILKQPGKVVYSIFDQKTLNEKKVREDLMALAIQHGYAYRANTLEELADMAGIAKKPFLATMAAYNDAAKTQQTKALPVPKILIGETVTEAPFYAVPLTTTIHHTMGGLKINTKTQVLDTNGKVIPGLYAAGEITGGIHGGNRLGRNALTDLLVFGHIAGLEASQK